MINGTIRSRGPLPREPFLLRAHPVVVRRADNDLFGRASAFMGFTGLVSSEYSIGWS